MLFIRLKRQLANLRGADVGVVGLGIDGEQGDAVVELGIIDDAEAAAFAPLRRAIGQAYFVDGVADAGNSIAWAFIVPETLE